MGEKKSINEKTEGYRVMVKAVSLRSLTEVRLLL
jgi:hypothetical protein